MGAATDLAAWNDPDFAALGGIGGPPARTGLTRKQKAAVMVRILLAEGVQLSLARLPEALQLELTRLMAEMRYVDRSTLKSVIDEFVEELDAVGLSFPGGIEGALAMLEGSISPETASRLRKQAGLSLHTDPWPRLADLDVDTLLPIFTSESIEVCAILLSKLKVSRAAEVLGRLPGPRARRITYAVSLTGQVRPETVRKIGVSLAAQLGQRPDRAFSDGPVERIGAILNFSPSATRDAMLAGLDETDRTFADEVRKAIFTFANIPQRIDPRDIPRITRGIDQKALVTALAAGLVAEPPAAEFILGALSQRLAQQLREEIETLGPVKPAAGEEAMSAVVAQIRAMEEAGDLLLLADEDP